MFRVLFWVIFLTKIYAENLTYFEERKQMLKEEKIVLHPRPKKTNVIPFYYKPQKPNPYNYQKIINEKDLCSKHEKVFLFVAVRSIYSSKFQRKIFRDVVRFYHNQDSAMRVVYGFFFGRSTNKTVNKLIKEESLLHGDILQEDYIESYANLPLKLIQMWKWSLEYCPNTEYFMMINDELFLDLVKLVPVLIKDYFSTTPNDHFAICYRVGNTPVIHKEFPRYKTIPLDKQYKGKRYPYYCHGFGYAAHITVINKLYKASNSTTTFMPCDAWVGILAEKLRLNLLNRPQYYTLSRGVEKFFSAKSYFALPQMIAVTDFGFVQDNAKQEKMMLNLFDSMKKHYKNLSILTKNLSVKREPEPYHKKDEHLFSKSNLPSFKIYLPYIMTFIFLLLLIKPFRNAYKLCCTKCYRCK